MFEPPDQLVLRLRRDIFFRKIDVRLHVRKNADHVIAQFINAAGELAGGANGANRLSGNALPEAVVFGERAGEAAARFARGNSKPAWDDAAAAAHLELVREARGRNAGKGASLRVTYADARRMGKQADLCDDCAGKMPGQPAARRGRRPKSATAQA